MNLLRSALRRVRILEYVLFGAFIGCTTGTLKGDALVALGSSLSRGRFLLSPTLIAGVFVVCLTPLAVFLFRRLIAAIENRGHISFTLRHRLTAIVACFFAIGLLLPTDEQTTLELRTARFIATRQPEAAIAVGKDYQQPTPTLLALRALALSQLQTTPDHSPLAERFFDYPLPPKTQAEMLHLDTAAATIAPFYAHIQQTVAEPPLREVADAQALHLQLISLLLERKLIAFAHAIPAQWRSSQHLEEMPSCYREALVLYQRQSMQPLFSYSDPATEALHRDFSEARKKLQATQPQPSPKAAIIEANALRSDYGQTYWHYFYYNSLY